MTQGRVEVRGLRELSSAFRAVDRDLPKQLRVEFKGIAEHVIGVAQGKMEFGGGEAANSLRPRATQKGAGIAFPAGGKPWEGVKAAYYPWLDFGGTVGKGRRVKRDRVKGGRYVYPAIAESGKEIAEQVDDAVETVAERARFTTRGSG